MRIRTFIDADAAVVHSIQVKCTQAAQWREEDYARLARDPLGTVLVAELEDRGSQRVVGFAAFHRVADEAELHNLAVEPLHQGKGVGQGLLAAGVRALQKTGVRRIFLEVRASNHPAIRLYASAGFKTLFTRRAYYDNPVEDAQVMAHEIRTLAFADQDPQAPLETDARADDE
jgi:[ribosomal protein S18]-alanine N-acetyltransferase